ncbi:carbon-nitrogen hydrolase [Microdochium trichocladiopsis]|uniref:Carbon-nitrogen hydrolase n=1 Tax=Microdochium trichocladiopsis TaxID=1682393 RepID=A0A9P8XVX8_9PEZI|nr:carbon-nitrogen hydrolase [Microdochium trichocladiopsis]KAH7021139.1 carbon-nitrogen hydrolase [Microdochium trichocladiopsis]
MASTSTAAPSRGTPPSGKIRLATASPGTQATTRQTVGELEQIARRAAAEGQADILLLPEAYLGGYPRGSDFGCKIGARDPRGREEFLEYFKQAVDLGDVVGEAGAGGGESWVKRSLGGSDGGGVGETTTKKQQQQQQRGDGTREELERIAKETGVFLVVGLVEKAGGSLYCAAVYVCPSRGMIGKRRKVMPTGTERLIWAQGSPATLKAVSTVIRGVRINMAAAICWESYMPLLRQAIYAQNVNLYLAPTADNRDAWMSLMRTVALEGRCFVVSANMCVPEGVQSATNGQPQQAAPHSSSPRTTTTTTAAATTGERRRRNSCMTEEGFEIALPSAPASSSSAAATSTTVTKTANTRTRRRSVLDEDGNEIVLCKLQQELHRTTTSEAVLEEPEDDVDTAASTTATATTNGATNGTTNGATNGAKKHTARSFISRGGSSIVSPTGDVVAGPQWEDNEGIIYADVDFDDCIRGRLDLDAAGSYSR